MLNYVDILIPVSSGDTAVNIVLDSLISQSQYISTVYLIVSSNSSDLPHHISFTLESLSPYFTKRQKEFQGFHYYLGFFLLLVSRCRQKCRAIILYSFLCRFS